MRELISLWQRKINYLTLPFFVFLLIIGFCRPVDADCNVENVNYYEDFGYKTVFRDDNFDCKSSSDPMCTGLFVIGDRRLVWVSMLCAGTYNDEMKSRFTFIDCRNCPDSPIASGKWYSDWKPTVNGWVCNSPGLPLF